MTPTTTAPPGRTAADARARAAALVSGATGIAANVFLVLFYALAAPNSETQSGAGWLGPAADWLEIPQFLALVPVVTALGRRLPRTRSLRVVTVAGAAAMATTAAAQLLLVFGLLRFEVQIVLVVAALALGYLWLLAISLAGHRTATLPRQLTLAGLLIGPSLPVGLVLAAAALVASGPARPALLVAGIAIGAAGWLALPVLPLLVARFVVPKVVPKEES